MKKVLAIVCVLTLLLTLGGCGLLGSKQQRNVAEFVQPLTDGAQAYYDYYLIFWEGYFREENGAFVLAEDLDEASLTAQESGIRVVMDARRTGISQNLTSGLAEADAFLEDDFQRMMEAEQYFEWRLYEQDGEYYGILNCYDRCSGASGTQLSFEDLKYSCLLTVQNEDLAFGEHMEETALLACNRRYYIAAKDEAFYSVCKETGESVQIMEDAWWHNNSGNQDYVNFCQSEDVFYMRGRYEEKDNRVYALYACYMDGTGLTELLRETQ